MKNTCWKLFSYRTIDHQAAQDFLNEMASEGWQLNLIVLNLFARFQRTERTDLSYYLDWADPKRVEDPDYIRMCAESGWFIKYELGYWNLYESRPGFSPVPIQTDPELEYQRFRRKAVRRAVISGVISWGFLFLYVGLLFALLSGVGTRFDWEDFLLDIFSQDIAVTFALVFLPLIVAAGFLSLRAQLRRLWVWRRALRLGEVPCFSRKTAEVWKRVHFLYFCFTVLFFLSMLAETLVNGGFQWGSAVGIGVVGLWYLTRDNTNRMRFQMGLAAFILGGSLLLAMALHAPFRSVFPGRFPTAPLTETGVVGRVLTQTDAPLGSSLDWMEQDDDHRYWFTARTWAIPALAERDAERAAEGMYPVLEQQGVWIREHGVALFYRGNTVVEVIYGEDKLDPAFSNQVWAWIEHIK